MAVEQNSNEAGMFTFADPMIKNAAVPPVRNIEIIRAESELRAIDELMAELTSESVANKRD